MNLHFPRLNDQRSQREVADFGSVANGKCRGAKFALNPGIDALDQIWFHKVYEDAKFIFIIRNIQEVYMSYFESDKDSLRGAIPWHAYQPMYNWQLSWLVHFSQVFPERSHMVSYAKMIEDPDKELEPVWKLLDVPPATGLKDLIRPPKHNTKEVK
jgi:hypothetical protein